jgi:hypothetical protein
MDTMNPRILTQPNIPKPMHGMAPREIMGKDWWEFQKSEAKLKNNGCCDACGIPKNKAIYHQWLEAHEAYITDYKALTMRFEGILMLCYSCHCFIHSGRLWALYNEGLVEEAIIRDIISRGLNILRRNNLKPFIGTFCIAETLGISTLDLIPWSPIENEGGENWDRWRLIFEGKEYPGKFKNFEEWKKFFSTKKDVD